MGVISILTMVYKPTYNWGAPPWRSLPFEAFLGNPFLWHFSCPTPGHEFCALSLPIFTTHGFILLEIFRNWLYFRNLAHHAANKINQVVSNTRVNPLIFPVEMWNHRLFILKKKMGLEFLVPCAEAATVHVASEFVFGSYRGQFQKHWKKKQRKKHNCVEFQNAET